MIFGKYINRYYLKNAPVLLLGLLALLMVDYIQLLIPQFYRLVINGVNLGQVVVNGQTLPFTKEVLLQHICLPMIWIVVLMVIGRFLWRICFFGSAVRVAANLRERMFDHSRQLSQQYYQVNKVGNLMSLYTNDIDTIQECFGDGILMFFDALVLGLMALYKMWRMDYKLTLLALIPALIMFGIGTVMGTAMTKRWEERQQAFSDLSDFAQENFSGIAVIKAFVKELKELMAFRKLNKQNEEINVIYTKIATLLEVLVTLFVESVICVILGYGGYLVYQGRFNAGQLVEYIGYFEAIVWPIMAFSMLIEKTSRGKASLNRITELLDAPIDVADRPGVQELQNPQGSVEFRHLTFRYPDGEYDVLQDISFTIHPGESVGIVGKTGAGKTALVDLLLRTYNVPDGTLFVAFMGTDTSLAGWKEDFNMSFLSAVPAQTRAVSYAVEMASLCPALPLRIGGHSKGGNLAAWAAIYLPAELQKDRLLSAYNNDGPGFARDMLETPEYLRVADKLHTYIPESSIVGVLLVHAEDYDVIDSTSHAAMQHEALSWSVVGTRFVHLGQRSQMGRLSDDVLREWIGSMTPAEREQFTDALFDVLSLSGKARTLDDLRSGGLAGGAALLKQYAGADEQKKKIISEIFRRLAVDVKGELKRAAGEGLEGVKKAAGEGLEAAKNAITSLTRGEK